MCPPVGRAGEGCGLRSGGQVVGAAGGLGGETHTQRPMAPQAAPGGTRQTAPLHRRRVLGPRGSSLLPSPARAQGVGAQGPSWSPTGNPSTSRQVGRWAGGGDPLWAPLTLCLPTRSLQRRWAHVLEEPPGAWGRLPPPSPSPWPPRGLQPGFPVASPCGMEAEVGCCPLSSSRSQPC